MWWPRGGDSGEPTPLSEIGSAVGDDGVEDPEVHHLVGDPELLQVLLKGLLRVRTGAGLGVQELG